MALSARRTAAVVLLAAASLTACTEQDPALRVPPAPAEPEIALPSDPLTALVPALDEVPEGMLPLLTGSGKRDAAAVAAYSADPAAAAAALGRNGFQSAYVAQYADPSSPRVLSVVVTQFAASAGARADLDGDLAASAGEPVPVPVIGEAAQARRQPLPGGAAGELVTLRFRQGRNTWLLAYGDRPRADPQVATSLALLLVDRARTTA